jgi:hypothetical protein
MEIQVLKLSVNDADLNRLASRTFSWPDTIRNVRFAVVPEGIRVIGTYQRFIAIPFHVLWQVSVSEGRVIGRIERLKAGFLSLGFLKPYLLNVVSAATGIAIRDEVLILDVDALLADHGWPVRINLSSIGFNYGSLFLESCEPGAGNGDELITRK